MQRIKRNENQGVKIYYAKTSFQKVKIPHYFIRFEVTHEGLTTYHVSSLGRLLNEIGGMSPRERERERGRERENTDTGESHQEPLQSNPPTDTDTRVPSRQSLQRAHF